MAELKIVSYNLDHSYKRDRLHSNIAHLAQQGAEIFCLQEVRTPKNGEEFIGDSLIKMLGDDWKGKFLLGNNSNDYGMGMVWNEKIYRSTGFLELYLPVLDKLKYWEKFWESVMRGDIGKTSDKKPAKRAALVGTFESQGQSFRISNIHLDWQGGLEQRLKQLTHVNEHLKSNPQVHEIICGDFNTLGLFGNKKQIQKIQNLLGPEFINCFPEFKLTTAHHQQLDHIFVKNFTKKQAAVSHWPGSDHFPISVYLSFK